MWRFISKKIFLEVNIYLYLEMSLRKIGRIYILLFSLLFIELLLESESLEIIVLRLRLIFD